LPKSEPFLAQKRNTTNFFRAMLRGPVTLLATVLCCGASFGRRALHQISDVHPRRPWVDVPLDAVTTKSEDCQRDIGKNLRALPYDRLKLDR